MVGILTFHDRFNYGAFLQAYAIQNVLINKGIDNKIIDYINRKGAKRQYYYTIIHNKKNPVTILLLLIKVIRFKIFQKKKLVLSNRFCSAHKLHNQQFDTVIIGSDQVWCYTKEWNDFDPVYFSKGINAGKIITYAVSMGPDKYDQQHPGMVYNLLENFHAISVRDNNTSLFVEKILNKQPKLVLDPTLLYDFKNECITPKEKDYILFYSDGLYLAPAIIDEIKQIAQKWNCKIISIGYKFNWADKNILTATPFEFLGYVNKAKFVITCMFHGVLFSLKYNRNFGVYISESRKNKIYDFLERVHLEDRIFTDKNSFNTVINTDIDFQKANAFLEHEKAKSMHFLLNNI